MMSKKLALLTVVGTVTGIIFTIILTQTLLQPLINRLDWFETRGWVGAFAFLILYIPMGLILVPASFHKFVAGMLFGFWLGCVIAWVGAMLGAIIPFLLASRRFDDNNRIHQPNHRIQPSPFQGYLGMKHGHFVQCWLR